MCTKRKKIPKTNLKRKKLDNLSASQRWKTGYNPIK